MTISGTRRSYPRCPDWLPLRAQQLVVQSRHQLSWWVETACRTVNSRQWLLRVSSAKGGCCKTRLLRARIISDSQHLASALGKGMGRDLDELELRYDRKTSPSRSWERICPWIGRAGGEPESFRGNNHKCWSVRPIGNRSAMLLRYYRHYCTALHFKCTTFQRNSFNFEYWSTTQSPASTGPRHAKSVHEHIANTIHSAGVRVVSLALSPYYRGWSCMATPGEVASWGNGTMSYVTVVTSILVEFPSSQNLQNRTPEVEGCISPWLGCKP